MTTIAVAVVVRHGHVLVGRRAEDARDAPGLDEFPGGKVEPGEAPEAAAVRECMEEAGIAVQTGTLLDRCAAAATSSPVELLFFAAAPLGDHDEPLAPFVWVPLAELSQRRFPPANARVLDLLHQGGS